MAKPTTIQADYKPAHWLSRVPHFGPPTFSTAGYKFGFCRQWTVTCFCSCYCAWTVKSVAGVQQNIQTVDPPCHMIGRQCNSGCQVTMFNFANVVTKCHEKCTLTNDPSTVVVSKSGLVVIGVCGHRLSPKNSEMTYIRGIYLCAIEDRVCTGFRFNRRLQHLISSSSPPEGVLNREDSWCGLWLEWKPATLAPSWHTDEYPWFLLSAANCSKFHGNPPRIGDMEAPWVIKQDNKSAQIRCCILFIGLTNFLWFFKLLLNIWNTVYDKRLTARGLTLKCAAAS